MKIIAIVSQKGGVGKTTLALHLAVAAEEAGFTTALIDIDPQASAAGWKDSRAQENPVVITLPHTRLPQGIEAARTGGAKLLIIDSAPKSEAAELAAMRVADLVLIPSRPGILDLRAIANTGELLGVAQKPAFVVLNTMPPQATQILADAKAAVETHGLKVAPVVIHQRAAYSHSLTAGQTATEYEKNGKAAKEVADLWKWARKMLAL